jgi:trans-aconitate methyltransferase
MSSGLVYRNRLFYESAMVLLYGRHYASRYRAIARLIPPRAQVLELCCGPAVLYRRYLRSRGVRYRGLDIHRNFVDELRRRNIPAEVWDLQSDRALPAADNVIMQASLYHFLPDASGVVERMLRAARRQVIVAEPIVNLTDSSTPVIAALARRLSRTSQGEQSLRFTEKTLDAFFEPYRSRVRECFLIPGGREKVYVLTP